jgi:putative salt-induced outer membrane protein
MRSTNPLITACGAAVAIFGICGTAPAETADMPKGLSASKPATTGSTDVATSNFESAVKPVQDKEKDKDTTEAKISAGGLFTAGNTQSRAITSGATFRLRRGDNQLSIVGAGNYASARPQGETATKRTVQNVQGKARYDRFLTPVVALFGSASARNDRFQGLDLRLNLDPGVALYVVDEKTRQLWTEMGYDYQHDIRNPAALQTARLTDPTLAATEDRHSCRAFVGYNDTLNSNVSMTTGLELLQAVVRTENRRINWDIALNAAVAGKLSVATTFTLRYDHHPLPGIKNTDAIEAVSLVYTLM